ncbi:MAG: bifunctional 2-C-methyl-D-erythritol 4-phosphate cytidylyltransferase/2-C-methyl-D-erythritol 2,4-cyclodiphosphate synthase [Beijerinckiaceae bacterium]|nr:MAG: bifunctional 2-C-methyl-D-erythritol 4-phosphate cytidylyltransferase/2-C-methyl-D-erythritol 2,4-cyclodiphosphate synthase [Beijerinckiaceae bacterium]
MAARGELAILVVAAGRGLRAGAGIPKQYREIAGRPLLAHTLSSLLKATPAARLMTVIHPDDQDLYAEAIAHLSPADAARLCGPAHGGETRQDSVRLGLEALAAEMPQIEVVLIHDGARPFSSPDMVARAWEAAKAHGAAVPGLALTDTVKEIDAQGRVVATPQRAMLRTVQTPQAFRFDLILKAHRNAAQAQQSGLTDDAAIAEWAGHSVHIFEGERTNMKITSSEDIGLAESKLLGTLLDVRMGQGFDVHAFGPGDHIWLGGLKIPHDHGLVGHSDADVLSHAITDAILGAIADGDIGSHFPPSDPQWRGAASSIFLQEAMRRLRARGGVLAHLDATIICEKPKIGPHRDAIRESLAALTGVSLDRIAVKATTSEHLGFTGREEGMAAMAIVTVRLPL